MVLTTGSHLRKPTSPARSLKPRLPVALTGAGGHAAGTKGVPALGVGHGLKGVRVVGDQGWAVQLTDAAVVEVEAGLGDRQLVVTGLLPPDVRGARGQCQARCPCPSPPRGGGPARTYQAVRVLGARAAGSTLLVAAVGGQRALAAGAAAGTQSSSHCRAKGGMRAGWPPGHRTLVSITFWERVPAPTRAHTSGPGTLLSRRLYSTRPCPPEPVPP